MAICRAASSPFKPGIAISIKTMSGSRFATNSSLTAVGCFSNDFSVRDSFQKRTNTGSHQGVVVGDQDEGGVHMFDR